MKKLAGKVALVAGATRGAGRAIAEMLGEAGATVYCTGRSSRRAARPRAKKGAFVLASRPETIEETAERVTGFGGRGIAVRVDHTIEAEVRALVKRIQRGAGRLDILVNDVWGGEELVEHVPFWESDVAKMQALFERAVMTHLITARHALPLLIETGKGLLVEVTDGFSHAYRSHLIYDMVKSAVVRLAFGLSEELRPKGITAVAVSPGFLRSEAMLDHFGVTEANWRDAIEKDRHFANSESPRYVGRGIAALAADKSKLDLSGRALTSADLSRRYGVRDDDGTRPDCPRYFATSKDPELVQLTSGWKLSRERFAKMFTPRTCGSRTP